jgi:hypothetical protein
MLASRLIVQSSATRESSFAAGSDENVHQQPQLPRSRDAPPRMPFAPLATNVRARVRPLGALRESGRVHEEQLFSLFALHDQERQAEAAVAQVQHAAEASEAAAWQAGYEAAKHDFA